MKRIIIDLMGADNGAAALLQGAARVLDAHPDLGLLLVGREAEIRAALPDTERTELLHTDDWIRNDENPAVIFRGRDRSSAALALTALRDREDCVGLLSAGSTGALMVGAIFRLGLQPGLKSPVLSASIPRPDGGFTCLLDCGAAMECEVADYVNFARLGDAYARAVYGLPAPRVALLNVGREPGKGTRAAKAAYDALQALPLRFVGNAEAGDLLSGFADVLVADGFSGNVLLKSCEAAGLAALALARQEGASEPVLDRIYAQFALNDQGGATFLGTVKPIIKMHGCATADTVTACVDQLLRLCRADPCG